MRVPQLRWDGLTRLLGLLRLGDAFLTLRAPETTGGESLRSYTAAGEPAQRPAPPPVRRTEQVVGRRASLSFGGERVGQRTAHQSAAEK